VVMVKSAGTGAVDVSVIEEGFVIEGLLETLIVIDPVVIGV